MADIIKIERILSQIKQLDYDSRLYLVERIIKLLKLKRNKAASATHNLTELNGLGANIWKNVDIDQYINEERQWD